MPYRSKLTLVPRSSRGLSYEIKDTQTPCLIGRDPSATICLLDRSVSRRHATLLYESGEWYLEDHSQNGTYINGKKVWKVRVPLKHGDHVRVGLTLDHTVIVLTQADHAVTATRTTLGDYSTVAAYPDDQLRVLGSGEVWVGHRRLDLSEQECKLVRLLDAARGRHCSNDEIINHVFNGVGNNSNVQELVKRVREKIRAQTGIDGGRYIRGYHGGYVLHTRPQKE